MLTELLDLVADDPLERLAYGEPLLGPSELGERRLGRRSLHFDPDCHAIDVNIRIVVDGETTGKRFAQLDCAEGGGKGEQLGDVCEVAQGLGMSRQWGLALEGGDGCRGMGGQRGRARVERLPCAA